LFVDVECIAPKGGEEDKTAEPKSTRKVIILVPGMHRSGTSAVSGTLNLLGVAIPGDLLPPTDDNKKGYFENKPIVAWHDKLLEQLKSRWEDPLPLREDSLRSPTVRSAAANELAALFQQEFGDEPMVLVKDPRLCRLLPVWTDAFSKSDRDLFAVLPVRHPFEVAASLQRRDSLPRAHALALWLQHVLAAEHASRGLARCFVAYDDLLQDWRSVVHKISGTLGLAWPRESIRVADEIDEFLSSELRHHRSTKGALLAHDALHSLCVRAWSALKLLCADDKDESARAKLDEIEVESDSALGILGPLVASLDGNLVQARSQLAERDGQIENLTRAGIERSGEAEQLRAEVARHSAEAEQLRAELGQRGAEAEQLRAELGQRGAEAEQLRAEVTRHACEAEAAHKAAERTAHQLRTASATTSVAEREAMQLRERAERAAAEIDRLLTDAQAEQARLRRELDDVLRSTFWRITEPVRRAASVLPPGLRRQGRRSFMVAYWVLTPHRTRERIAYFRARRESLRPPPPVIVDPPPIPPVPPHGTSGSLDNAHNSGETKVAEPTPELISRRTARSKTDLLPISVVIPTHNRADLLEKTLRSCIENSGMAKTELIVIDDGSGDHTSNVLRRLETEIHNLTWRSIPNGGPGQARNLGAAIASHPILLFLGDDIQPADDQFFAVHARLHSLDRSEHIAVLGKVVWPSSNVQDTNFVMSHIQGRGGEQFSYAHLNPHTFVDWRFFYTANISVKKSLVADWNEEGFRPEFMSAAFEDGEFAYRMQTRPNPLKIYYDPASAGYHMHPYDLDGFIRRQEVCGKMAKVFIGLHPEVSEILQLPPLVRALRKPLEDGYESLIADYASIVEGIKSWARVLEHTHDLGHEWWHDDLLSAVFELSYLHGFMVSYADESLNLPAGYNHIIERCIQRLKVVIDRELTSNPQLQGHFGLLYGAG
jgi:glycosyltransferase involved in cell wall biosynthesis